MSKLRANHLYMSDAITTPVSFENPGNGMRYLRLHDQRAFELSFHCGTCAFLFERLEGANDTVDIGVLDSQLRAGLISLDPAVIAQLAPLIPAGPYLLMLLELTPELVIPAASNDYFVHEQLTLWGVRTFWGLPHSPKVPYYRSHSQELGNDTALYEFVVPMVPPTWLDTATWQAYQARIAANEQPTAVAISILDIKGPATWEGDPAINEHWCLTHFVLDGHHKLYAAAHAHKPLTLVSFLAINESIARDAQIQEVARVLAVDESSLS
jgi:hypothetical protein